MIDNPQRLRWSSCRTSPRASAAPAWQPRHSSGTPHPAPLLPTAAHPLQSSPAFPSQTGSAFGTQAAQPQLRCRNSRRLGNRHILVLAVGGQLLQPATKVSRMRSFADILDRQPKTRCRLLIAVTSPSNRLHELRSIPQEYRRGRYRIPQHLAEPAKGSPVPPCLVPIRLPRLLRRSPIRSNLPELCPTVPEYTAATSYEAPVPAPPAA